MAEKPKNLSPPYATFPTFINFINKLRESQIPSRIDPSVFGNASGSVSYSIIAALKSLKLISAEGTPTSEFVAYVNADDEARKPLLREILKVGYPTLWAGQISLGATTSGQFDEHIRSEYDVKGSTVDKVATFFIAAAKSADLQISPHLAARKPTATSTSASKSKRQRREGNGGDGFTSPATTNNDHGSNTSVKEKELEYRLVDLMADAMTDQEVLQAIIKVVTFLKARDAKKTATDQ